jgi:hypothetical protein
MLHGYDDISLVLSFGDNPQYAITLFGINPISDIRRRSLSRLAEKTINCAAHKSLPAYVPMFVLLFFRLSGAGKLLRPLYLYTHQQ